MKYILLLYLLVALARMAHSLSFLSQSNIHVHLYVALNPNIKETKLLKM